MLNIDTIIEQRNTISDDYRQVGLEKWSELVKKSGFTKSDEIFSRKCKSRKVWFGVLIFIVILLSLGSIAFSLFLFIPRYDGGPANPLLIFLFVCLILFFVSGAFGLIFYKKKTTRMYIKNNENLMKIKNTLSDSIFHNAMFDQIKEIKKMPYSAEINKKFSRYIIGEAENNCDLVLPIYINNRNAVLHSGHTTVWIEKAYFGTKDIPTAKGFITLTETIMWPFPQDCQNVSITDTTRLVPELEYSVIKNALKSERSQNKFNKKNSQFSLENREFNELFPAIRNDEQMYRTIFDLTTQENIVKVFKQIGDFQSEKKDSFVWIYKHDIKILRTFAPCYFLRREEYYTKLQEKFLHYFKNSISDFRNLVAAYLSFSCFELEKEKEYPASNEICDIEIESLLYGNIVFPHTLPKKSKLSTIHHFKFVRKNIYENEILCLEVNDDQMYSTDKIVRKGGVDIHVEDFKYDKSNYHVFLKRMKNAESNLRIDNQNLFVWNNIIAYVSLAGETDSNSAKQIIDLATTK